jgi:hypothetical protein
MRAIADAHKAWLLADMAHISGLVAAGVRARSCGAAQAAALAGSCSGARAAPCPAVPNLLRTICADTTATGGLLLRPACVLQAWCPRRLSTQTW